jgi:sulfatase maturation enzyme AslB (radical SAM superfamily)
MTTPTIHSVILKVAAPCNLDCTYCYEYNRGDSSWKSKPKRIADSTVEQVGRRVLEYATAQALPSISINLHGGEPTLLGADGIDAVLSTLRRTTAGLRVKFGMQTNGTLVSDALVATLIRHEVKVGLSLDGDAHANRHRVDHRGRPSWDAAVAGLRKLQDAGLLAGIQAVIDLDSDPEAVLDQLGQFRPPEIELGQPFGNHDNPPDAAPGRTLGAWLIQAYEHLRASPHLAGIRVNVISDAFTAILTERSRSDWFPSAAPGYLVVATDGSYEGLDTLKVVGEVGRVLNLNVHDHTIEQALDHEYITARSPESQLPTACHSCPINSWCRGGYYPTRFGRGRGFDNPSIYCRSLVQLFTHFGYECLGHPDVPMAARRRIESQLQRLTVSAQPVPDFNKGGRT